jgi:ornithine carbamoyltransferase
MTVALRNRHFLRELDFTSAEINYLLGLAAELKVAKRAGKESPALLGKNIALIFEKSSTRTRCAFEVAASDQGARATYLGPDGTQIGYKESIRDTARVLGRMYDAIEYRGFAQSSLLELADNAGVPVYNGLTDSFHPTQSLCDVFTMGEHSAKPLTGIALCYLGDARNNMGNSLLAMASVLGMDVRLTAPRGLWPTESLVAECRRRALDSGARILLTESVEEGVAGADFLYTDVWVSMGEPPASWTPRIAELLAYQINAGTLAATGVADTKVMHCLPALHNRRTTLGEKIFREHGLDGLEITEEVFEGPQSIVFDQAENRLHTIKAVLVATMGG